MTDFIDMTLKILYTLDDSSNASNNVSYLARSKKPQRVRVADIPNLNDLYSNSNIDNHKTSNNNIHNLNSSNLNMKNIDKSIINIENKFNGLDNNDCGVNLKVGLVNFSTILNEIYINSPEVLQINNDLGIDYNVYYRDICEVNQPLVSLGLLSDIQSKLFKINNSNNKRIINNNSNNNNNNTLEEVEKEDDDENVIIIGDDNPNDNNNNIDDMEVEEEEEGYVNDYGDEEDEEDLIVTGRVCSNFSALLRRSYSNSQKSISSNGNNNNNSNKINLKKDICMNNLEIKLKFSKIVLPKKPKSNLRVSNIARCQNTVAISPLLKESSQYSVPSLPKKINKIVKPKRQTNPLPAPKAKRTQSLPLWSLNASGMGLRNGKTSIAHKIFMADRLMQKNNLKFSSLSSNYPKKHMFTYEINSLQNDNTIQRNIVDDSVSKRFDFMNKKLNGTNHNGSSPLKQGRITSKKTSSNNKKSKTTRKSKAKSKSSNTITTRSKKISPSQSHNIPDVTNDSFVSVDSNKENIPPLNNKDDDDDDENSVAPLAQRMDTRPIDSIHTDRLDLYALNFEENALNWFEETTKNQLNSKETRTSAFMFGNDNIKFNDILLQNNCKDHINNNVTPRDILDDPDRTSPLDTLSVPLMELEQDPSSLTNLSSENGLVHGYHNKRTVSRGKKRITTCQDQLNRLPILLPSQFNLSYSNSNNKNSKVNRIDMDDTPQESNHMEDVVGSEATILLNYNTSPLKTLPNDNLSRSNLGYFNQYHNNNESFDEEEKKRQRILPSSPSMIFDYRSVSLQIDVNDDNNANMTPDLFSKFIDQNHNKVDNGNRHDQLDILMHPDDNIDSDFEEMRFPNTSIYTPATTVHFTSEGK